MTLGAMLYDRRVNIGIETQEMWAQVLARHGIDVSRQTISNWERDKTAPPRRQLAIVLDVLGLYGDARDRAYRLAAGE